MKDVIDFADMIKSPLFNLPKPKIKSAYGSWEELLEHVTYKPGVSLGLRNNYGRSYLVITAHDVEDTYHPGSKIAIAQTHPLPDYGVRGFYHDHAVDFLRRCLHDFECHEADEWLKVDGVMPFDPHSHEFRT